MVWHQFQRDYACRWHDYSGIPDHIGVTYEEGNPAGLSSCSGGLKPLVELCVEPAGLCGQCTGAQPEGKIGLPRANPRF